MFMFPKHILTMLPVLNSVGQFSFAAPCYLSPGTFLFITRSILILGKTFQSGAFHINCKLKMQLIVIKLDKTFLQSSILWSVGYMQVCCFACRASGFD